jgi:hypothetical protein
MFGNAKLKTSELGQKNDLRLSTEGNKTRREGKEAQSIGRFGGKAVPRLRRSCEVNIPP